MIDQVTEVKDRSDIVEIVSSYLTLKKAGTNLKACCPFHHEKSPSMMISPERQTFKCFGCFPAGQLVETKDGFKEIQTITPGEMVYTSNARLRRVNLVFEREYSGSLFEVSTRMITQPILITGDHNVYVIRTKNCKQKSRESRICQRNCEQRCPTQFFTDYKLEKAKASTLKINDYLLYPLKNNEMPKSKSVNLIEYTGATLKRGKKPRLFNSAIEISEKFARLSGLYIAEGSSHRAYIRFSFGNHEKHFATEVVALIKGIFGLESSIHERAGNKTGIEVTCCNSLLSRIFIELFGKGARNKRIPQFFFGQNQKVLESLLGGIVDGDGTISKDQKKCRGGRVAVKVISHSLVHQIKDILLSWDIRPSINYSPSYISKTGVNHREAWCVNWYEQVGANYSDILEINNVKYWLLSIREIKESIFEGLVYNLNVEDDHSYLTPSFMVANCGEGGDVITFIEKIEGLDFFNALKLLADKAGIELKDNSVKFGANEHKADKKTKMFEINEWTKKVYHQILVNHPKAEKAREYLNKRGMSDETIETFEIGYAPVSWDFLLRFLLNKKYTETEIVEAGVAIKSERGKVFDRFRGRIIFPIGNIMGNTTAFTSRILEDDGQSAKYINSSESPIYTKGKTIYALDKAKLPIKEADLAILVEGQMDVIACHQAGYKNVVATSGTALTLDQLVILNRYASVIAMCFDSDEAGQTAMKRAIRIAMQNDITTKIISMPKPFKDPDEAIKADPTNWPKAVKAAKPSLQYWIDRLLEKAPDPTVDDKKKIAKEILPIIKITSSEIEKEHYIKYLSEKIFISEKAIIESLEKSKADKEFSPNRSVNISEKREEKTLTALEKILGIIWANHSYATLAQDVTQNIDEPKYSAFIEMIKKGEIAVEKIPPALGTQLDQLSVKTMADFNSSDEDVLKNEFNFLIGRLRSDAREDLRENFARKIREAEESGDKELVRKLLSEFSTLIK